MSWMVWNSRWLPRFRFESSTASALSVSARASSAVSGLPLRSAASARDETATEGARGPRRVLCAATAARTSATSASSRTTRGCPPASRRSAHVTSGCSGLTRIASSSPSRKSASASGHRWSSLRVHPRLIRLSTSNGSSGPTSLRRMAMTRPAVSFPTRAITPRILRSAAGARGPTTKSGPPRK